MKKIWNDLATEKWFHLRPNYFRSAQSIEWIRKDFRLRNRARVRVGKCPSSSDSLLGFCPKFRDSEKWNTQLCADFSWRNEDVLLSRKNGNNQSLESYAKCLSSNLRFPMLDESNKSAANKEENLRGQRQGCQACARAADAAVEAAAVTSSMATCRPWSGSGAFRSTSKNPASSGRRPEFGRSSGLSRNSFNWIIKKIKQLIFW